MQHIAFIFLLFAFTFGNIYKISFFSPDVHISVLDTSVFIVNLIYILLEFRRVLLQYQKQKSLINSAVVFVFIGLFSLVLSIARYGINPAIVGSFYLIRWINYSILFLTIPLIFTQKWINRLIIFMGTVTSLLGMAQYILYPDVRWLETAEWDPHFYRIVGTLLDPGFTGLIILLTLIFLTFKVLSGYKKYLILWFPVYISLALTYSRSTYLAFLASMAYISWVKRNVKIFLLSLLLLLITITLLPRASSGEGVKLERTSSIHARIANWKNTFRIFTKYPIFGTGFNTFRYAQQEEGFLGESKWLMSHAGAGADSSLLFVAATTGIIGFIAYLYYGLKLWHRDSRNYLLKTSLAAVLVHSVFLNSLFYPWVMFWFMLLLAFRENKQPTTLSG